MGERAAGGVSADGPGADGREADDRPVLTVDLGAVVANWRHLARLARPAETAAVVKADAFGLGMARVAPALAAAGTRTFFIATLQEGIALRALLPDADIYTLDGVWPRAGALMRRHRLRPCLCSLEQLATWRAEGERQPAALHIDSGLNRLGLGPDEVARILAEPALLRDLNLALVMSHLACSEDRSHPMNRRQLDELRATAAALGLAEVPLSLAASAGVFLGSPFHLDMVRVGGAIYGLSVLSDRPNPMRQVSKLEAKIIQVRHVDRGMTVGYGATYPVGEPGRIAVVGLGYADGILRAIGNRGWAVLGGRRVPVAGRVSMDLITLDVSATPPGLARPGAWVELIGPNQTIDELAAAGGTIGYELMSLLGRRYRRAYLDPPSGATAGAPDDGQGA
jgi:alanine racemase